MIFGVGMTWCEHGYRLSVAKGEGEGEGRINAAQRGGSTNPAPHLHPLPFFEGRGDKSTLVN